MEPTFPVVKNKVEQIAALNQPEYQPLPFVSLTPQTVTSRWKLSDEERRAVASGADVFLTLYTFRGPMQPSYLFVAGSEITAEEAAEKLPAL